MKRLSFLGLAALLTAAALTSCQKELETDFPTESESELESADDATRSTYTGANYKLTSDWIKNPEKGLTVHYEYKFEGGNIPSVSSMSSSDGTLVFLHIYLKDFRETSTISSEAKTAIKNIFKKVKEANMKAVVRFSYTYSTGSWPIEPTKSRIKNHISTLSSILQEYSDYIVVFQCGFIGTWGEWYYTSQDEFNWSYKGGSSNGYSGSFSAYKEVINAMLSALPGRQVAVRGPYYKRFFLHSDGRYESGDKLTSFSSTNNGRIAFYNDAFMSDKYYDTGTFGAWTSDPQISTNKKMWDEQSPYLFCGGETANKGGTKSEMKSISNYDPAYMIKKYHLSYLKKRTDSDLYNYWKDNGKITEIKNVLGYRLWMNSFELKGNYAKKSSSSQSAKMVFSLKNDGAAPVIYQRPMKIVFIRNSDKKVTELASTTGSAPNYLYFASGNKKTYTKGSLADIRQIASGSTKYFTCDVTLPSNIQSGDMIALWMPDQGSSLRSKYQYSIRLCNKTGSSYGNVKWLDCQDRSGTMAGFNAIYTF